MLPCVVLFLFCAAAPSNRFAESDTLPVPWLAAAPILDGRIASGEYEASVARIRTAAGEVLIRAGHHGGSVYIAAELPDSTYYWGDDLVISLDLDGSGGAAPSAGDRQWYIRRSLDSTVVSIAAGDGRWSPAGTEPPRLGDVRRAEDWEIASESADHGWTIELRIDAALFSHSAAAPRIAFRTFNDEPRGWWSLPAPPEGVPAFRVEQIPDQWIPLRLAPARSGETD